MCLKNKEVTQFKAEHRRTRFELVEGPWLARRTRVAGTAARCCGELILPNGGIKPPLRQTEWRCKAVATVNCAVNRTTTDTPLALHKRWHGFTLNFQGEFF